VRNPVDRLTGGLPHGLRVAIDWIVTIAGAIAIVLAVKAYVVNPYRIPSSSMEPTLHCAEPEDECLASMSDRVLANRLIYRYGDPERGDVIVFDTPPEAEARCGAGGTFVKRVIVLPNEVWEMRSGVIYIGGKRLVEPYIQPERRATDTIPPQRVPEDSYVMLGDNRPHSCDSRSWGPVPRKNLIGKVFAVYWPPGRISLR
jgi:signal peptidase I